MNADLQQFTDDRMMEVLTRGAAQPLGEGVEELFAAVQTWCQPKGPKDDVSILGCEILGAPA